MTNQEALIALNLINDIGSTRLKNLLDAFGSAPKIFLAGEDRLREIEKIGVKIAREIATFSFEKLKQELELVKKLGLKIITLEDPEYPVNLKNIYDPPLCLYTKGDFLEKDSVGLGVVGSRRASYYGLSTAEKFSFELAQAGVTVISGLARGIDTMAHQGALKAHGRTIAVLGSGLNRIYPQENVKLVDEIAQSGVVVSEFPVNTEPLPRNFPRRNRIISGLSLGIIVVEAAKNSGALITADFALEQGRTVFAIPGAVNSATSFGANQLIKQGAKLVDSTRDILEELKPELLALLSAPVSLKVESIREFPRKESSAALVDKSKEVAAVLNAEESKVYTLVSRIPAHIDEIFEKSELPITKIMSVLLKLEMRKLIKQLPGKLFVKISHKL